MSEPKTTIDLPFSPEDVRMGRHLGNAIAGYRDGDFKRSAEGVVDAVRAFQAAAAEIDRLRAEVERLTIALETIADMWPWDGMKIQQLVRETLTVPDPPKETER